MAANLKDMEGWQIVNVDEDGKIINENRARRSRTGNRIKSTFLQRISDGLSFGVGDNIITHDNVTKTYSVYLVHEIRQNTVKSLVEIWAFSYLRWFELSGIKYFSQFDPNMVERFPNPKELNQQLFQILDPHELYLTAETVEFELCDFIDVAKIVTGKDFENGKAITDKDFIVNYICEPTGENFVKIDIFHELKLIKQFPKKQSDEHLKRLSTQRQRPASNQSQPQNKTSLKQIPSLSNKEPILTAVTVTNSTDSDDSNDDLPLSHKRRLWIPKSPNFSQSTHSDDTTSQKNNIPNNSASNSNDSNVVVSKIPENEEEKVDNNDRNNEQTPSPLLNLCDTPVSDVNINTISQGTAQKEEPADQIFPLSQHENNTKKSYNLEQENIYKEKVQEQKNDEIKKKLSLFVQDNDYETSIESSAESSAESDDASARITEITSEIQDSSDAENSFHDALTELPSQRKHITSRPLQSANNTKRKLSDESNNDREINDGQPERKKAIFDVTLANDGKDKTLKTKKTNRLSTLTKIDETVQSDGVKEKKGSIRSVLINPSTFKLIKTNYDKTLELINNFQNVNISNTELPNSGSSDSKGSTISLIGTLIKYDPKTSTKNNKQTLYSQIKSSSNNLSIELKLRSITRKKEGLSDVCNVFVDVYYDLFRRIRACSSLLLFCTAKKVISAEYVLQEVLSELSLSYIMKELQPFTWTHIYPIENPTIASLVIQIWKNISGELLQAKQAIGALFHFCKDVQVMRKKYIIVFIHNFESILNTPNYVHIIDLLMRLVQFPNSKLCIVCISNESPQLLKMFTERPNDETWKIVNFPTYPTNAIKMVIHSILYNRFYGTFFVKQDSASSSWSIRNLDPLITSPTDYTTAVSDASRDGYSSKHILVSPEDARDIIALLESHATHYDEILVYCKKAIFMTKWTYIKQLSNNRIEFTADPLLTLSDVHRIVDKPILETAFERVNSLPAISKLLLMSSLLNENGNIANETTVIHFPKLKDQMIKYMHTHSDMLFVQQVKAALSPNPNNLNEIMDSINWRFIFEKLMNLGLVNFSINLENDVNSIFFINLFNRLELGTYLLTCGSAPNSNPKTSKPTNLNL
ncbi:similar to Saccharomyces cerevisiae YML065W ORC1 Largest subunit of the origin recognition complex [Maudiozyma barnettii]|uniref:Similar to Saccharomyces cerevisiae YML065W ORC1 Largest subunit of the origin recognition complex n=1 Tax=Maudiozyma barnettii TaxID=61262 RepID=A0A8H2VJH1_9SACH|nr:uncharacterized protein KABA2_10S00902 [Kazachstania barnettii]CAB4256516.1 similar to Saccharomyces cerevisiae YML065W ORC1 Largest subunit of the origin recognition complex [Kazachstania barnettii]CAD1785119.1 similar to Saccharomyces cerevisiae YML065W ORC1 Largest subunit of the origin recognition complex [Kazachstania barnettii]